MFAIKYVRINKQNKPQTLIEYAETVEQVKHTTACLLKTSGYHRELNKKSVKNKCGTIQEINVYELNLEPNLTDWGINNKEEFEQLGVIECINYNSKIERLL